MHNHNIHNDAESATVTFSSSMTKDVTVEGHEQPYVGTHNFTLKIPTARDLLRMGLIRQRLIGEKNVMDAMTDDEMGLLYMLSTLSVVVIDAPSWWWVNGEKAKGPAPEQIHDIALLWDLYERFAEWRQSFRQHTGASQEHRQSAAGSIAVESCENPQLSPVQ